MKGNTMTQIEGLVFAGAFGVDSGQVMIGDPCYLDNYDPNENQPWELTGKEGEYSYHGACATTLKSNYGELGNGLAVVSSTGYGDGQYPVYVKLNEDNRVSMIVIDFEGELD
jgi:hypothetical protein